MFNPREFVQCGGGVGFSSQALGHTAAWCVGVMPLKFEVLLAIKLKEETEEEEVEEEATIEV